MKFYGDKVIHSKDKNDLFVMKHTVLNTKCIILMEICDDDTFTYEQFKKIRNICNKIAEEYRTQYLNL